MRITDIDLEIEDIEWYGVDEYNRIAQFTSGGSTAVPEFICESRERLDTVCEFFEGLNKVISEEVVFSEIISKYPRKEYLEECKKISRKGLYCYDISNQPNNTSNYALICKPTCELIVSNLPEEIQSILKYYKIGKTNFKNNSTVCIDKA